MQYLRIASPFFLNTFRQPSISATSSIQNCGNLRALSSNSTSNQESSLMANFKIAALVAAVVIALTAFGTTSVLSVAARLFCVGSVLIFAVSSTVGLVSRLRS
jgi:hypothetical protein